MLLAALEYQKKPASQPFSLHSAYEYLPKNIPLLREMYQLTVKTAEKQETIKFAVIGIIEQLDNTDLKAIYSKLSNHLEDEDPIIHFYEPFLAEYDIDEKNNRGVFYTPKQVVDFIVRGVDHLLKTKLDKPQGLSTYSQGNPEKSVHLLDPATGTGTFIISAVQHSNLKQLGEEIFKKQFQNTVKNHILKHFYAFELMVAPYTIAHLKLTLELQRLGFDFESVYNDSDKDNDRLKIYLANTLDAPKELTDYHTQGFGAYFESITREVQDANRVKTQEPVLVILGNPPYSVSSSNKGAWITELMDSYKKAVRSERNIQPLSDDYIKFIRFAQWKIEQTGQGIVAMITNHSFLGGLIHRGMRQELMKTFDEIYLMDLHGNTTVGEKNPSSGVDQNIFPIRQGVCIFFFIKKKTPLEKAEVYHAELWGDKKTKLGLLGAQKFYSVKWQRLDPEKTQNFFFAPKNINYSSEYNNYVSLERIFSIYSSGIKTHHDNELVSFDKFTANTNKKYLYRPFDIRYINYDLKKVERHRFEVMRHILHSNIALINCNQFSSKQYFTSFVTNILTDISSQPFASYHIFPLYSYESDLLSSKYPNINLEFIEQFDRKLFPEKYQQTIDLIDKMHEEKPVPTITPQQIFYYAYAILHTPTYRTRYTEELKIDFPRLPLTTNKDLFYKLVEKGNELVNLHLLGENPFDERTTIFADSGKWNVHMNSLETDEEVTEDKKYLVTKVLYDPVGLKVYFNDYSYFEGIEKEVWEFYIGGYQVLDRWLKERKKHNRILSSEDMIHFMKIVVSLRETINLMKEIDRLIPEWPMK